MENGNAAMGGDVLSRAMSAAAAPRVPAFEIDDVRSYMFEVETEDTLHIDRLGADDVARALEKMALGGKTWVCTDGDVLIIKLNNGQKVKVMRDAVAVKAGDYALVADDKFLLLRADRDGFYVPIAKGDEITWDGTEEYFTPGDVSRLAKETIKRILERAQWL